MTNKINDTNNSNIQVLTPIMLLSINMTYTLCITPYLIYLYHIKINVKKMKHVIITGATSGIGMEVAKHYIAAGCTVGIAGRRIEILEKIKILAPERIFIKKIDITEKGAKKLLDELIEECGGMDLYFHSSGIGYNNARLDEELELKTVATNCEGWARMINHAFNYFAEKGKGHIAAISSIAGTKGLGAAPAYSATKRFQNTYLSALKQQSKMRKADIRITDIRPGFVTTDLIAGANYPMQMDVKYAAREIYNAVENGKRIAYIDWKYAILVFFWRLIPRCVWERWAINVK